MSTPRTIAADHLQLTLVARRAQRLTNHPTRWAAMSDHLWSARSCRARFAPQDAPAYHRESTMAPMDRGHLLQAIERMRLTSGLPAVRATFGTAQ